MIRTSRLVHVLVVAGALLVAPSLAVSDPITYNSQLLSGVAVGGTISQPNASWDIPVGAEYYSFHATIGSLVTVVGNRLDGPYDMAFHVYSGIFTDTAQFGPTFDGGDVGYVGYGDDELPPSVPGPWGDPSLTFSALSTGWYTVAVTNFFSDGNPPYDFTLEATGVDAVPEPGTLLLLGAGLGMLRLRSRRRG